MTEDEARAMFERWRWPDGPKCPTCGKGSPTAYHDARRGTQAYRCHYPCLRIYTVKTGTFMQRSTLPYLTWARAFSILSRNPDIAPCDLRRKLGGHHATAVKVKSAIMATKRRQVG